MLIVLFWTFSLLFLFLHGVSTSICSERTIFRIRSEIIMRKPKAVTVAMLFTEITKNFDQIHSRDREHSKFSFLGLTWRVKKIENFHSDELRALWGAWTCGKTSKRKISFFIFIYNFKHRTKHVNWWSFHVWDEMLRKTKHSPGNERWKFISQKIIKQRELKLTKTKTRNFFTFD